LRIRVPVSRFIESKNVAEPGDCPFVGGSWGVGLLMEDDGGLGAIWLGVSG